MADNGYRGLEPKDELNPKTPRRDTRLFEDKIRDRFANPRVASVTLVVGYAMAYLVPLLLWLVFPVVLIIAALAFSNDKHLKLPMRLPVGANVKVDLNNPKPQHRGFWAPAGQFFMGTEKITQSQIWESSKDMLTHWLIVGGTGSGKTVTLISMVANSLAMGSGVLYSDAKATPDLDWMIATMARLFGREDDLLTTNFITGTSKYQEIDPERLSNTENPYAIGTADSLMQILSSLMSESGDGNKIFQDRAVAAMSGMLFALVELREKGELLMGIDTIRDHLSLSKFIETRHNPKVSERVRLMLYSYLDSALPGYIDDQPAEKQPEEVGKQHGFAQSYFTRAVASLTDTYGHIYLTNMGEVDKIDVVLNRRIAVTMLPALEKSTNELQNLGRMNFASLRDALRVGLGPHLEGHKAEVLDNLPTASNVPTLVILDELAYQMTDGMAVTAAQARGLGICMVFAMQDFAGPQKANEKEFQQVVGNTTNKLIMKLEDPDVTWTQVQKIAGEGITSEVQHLERRGGGVSSSYHDNPTASFQRRSRIDLMDLRDQVEGEGHLIFGSRIMRMDTFTVQLDIISDLRLNRFLCVEAPQESDFPEVQLLLGRMVEYFAEGGTAGAAHSPAGSAALTAAFAAYRDNGDEGHLLGSVAAIATYAYCFDRDSDAATGTGGGASNTPDDPVAYAEALVRAEEAPAEPSDAAAADNSRVSDAERFAGVPSEPAILDDEPQDAGDSEAPRDDSFLSRALDQGQTDFLFAFDSRLDLDYDIAGSLARVERTLHGDEDERAAEAQTVGEQIQQGLQNALRYPSPPGPYVTPDIEADIDASVATLLALDDAIDDDNAPPAVADNTRNAQRGGGVFGNADPADDL